MTECRYYWCKKTATKILKRRGEKWHYCTRHFLEEEYSSGKITRIISLFTLVVSVLTFVVILSTL